jgi:DNA-binding SARP family transcriptional activator/tetratricopeptide (TPR) repeat protein
LLRLTLFGQMRAEGAAGQSVLPRSRKTRALLAVLALAAPKPVLRARLTRLLWSGRAIEQGRGSLRQSVYELQHALGAEAASLLRAARDHLVLRDDRLWVDARALLATDDARSMDPEMFRAPLLDGLDGIDPAFDIWLAEERQRVILQGTLLAEAALAGAQDANSRKAAAELLLAIERTHEAGWQSLIRAHLELGDRTGARLAYDRCLATLTGAGLQPSREIATLLECSRGSAAALAIPADDQPVRLAVLPLRSLDGKASAGLMPGLPEELSAAISRFRWISCIAVSPQDLKGWHRSDADYTLDATLQRCGERIRIIIRLLDLNSGSNVVWARSHDSGMTDLLELQNTIAAETAAQIDPQMLLREGDRRAANPARARTSFDLTLRSIPAIYRLEPSSFQAAGEMLASAIDLEPANAAAHAWWAYWHLLLVGQAWAPDPLAATLRAGQLAERAVTLDPGDARALALVGHVRAFLHRQAEEARALHERAISLNPGLPLAWCLSGLAHCYLGLHETAVEQIRRAQSLAPHDPHAFFFDMALMMPYFLRGEFENAVVVGRRAVELNPGFSSTYKGYLATLGQLRRRQEAARVLARLLQLEPGFCVKSALERSPMVRLADQNLYAEGLRRAGLPEG